jgi:type I restriction enzyme S subunit
MFTINKRIAGTLGYDVLSITQKGIKIKDIVSNVGQQSSDYSKYQIVKPGDFAMNHMDLLTGFVDLSEVEGVTSPDYRVFTPISKDIDPHYALYIFQTAYRAKIFYGLGQGVSTLGRWRLPKEQFLNFVIPVPSLDEQWKIVRHLDNFCSSIDGLIQSYTDKLDNLTNFKASLIYEYVTGKKIVPQEVDA